MPDSHLSKVALDKLLSTNTPNSGTALSGLGGRMSDLQTMTLRPSGGPGSLFDTSSYGSKLALQGDSGKSPVKTPLKPSAA